MLDTVSKWGDTMAKPNQRDNPVWREAFGKILKAVFSTYSLNYRDFCAQYHCSEATFRYWQNGTKLPQESYIPQLQEFLQANITNDTVKFSCVQHIISEFLHSQSADNLFFELHYACPDDARFLGEVFALYRNVAKNKYSLSTNVNQSISPTGHIKAVVFDFDGTLTQDKANRTTWESLWINLGYSARDCQELLLQYNQKEISHEEWCKITELKFRERNLHRDTVEKIATKIHLLKGVRKTFRELRKRGIQIYVVSGSILLVIQTVLRDLCQYIDRIQANQFVFNEAGFLTQIIGTKYDFEGKAQFIKEIAGEFNIAPQDILFLGNSINDRFAYQSGAKTLCINPTLTDPSNRNVWNNCIQSCEDLYEIISFIDCDSV